MKLSDSKQRNELYLRAFGKHVAGIIKKKGYTSAYDFWISKAGDDLSRASLNYLLKGEANPKLTTLLTLARLLEVEVRELLAFEK